MNSEGQTSSGLVDREVNPRVLLAVIWVCHFILWIFGDQHITDVFLHHISTFDQFIKLLLSHFPELIIFLGL